MYQCQLIITVTVGAHMSSMQCCTQAVDRPRLGGLNIWRCGYRYLVGQACSLGWNGCISLFSGSVIIFTLSAEGCATNSVRTRSIVFTVALISRRQLRRQEIALAYAISTRSASSLKAFLGSRYFVSEYEAQKQPPKQELCAHLQLPLLLRKQQADGPIGRDWCLSTRSRHELLRFTF